METGLYTNQYKGSTLRHLLHREIRCSIAQRGVRMKREE